jgi:integrase
MTRRAHGEGSLYQLPSGRWRDTVELGWEGGKRRRKYVHGRSQREVREALDRIKRTRAEGLTPAPERLTVGRFLDEWLTLTVEPSLAPKTFRTYSGIVKGHIRPVLGHHRLSALAASDVQRMLNAKAAAGLSKRAADLPDLRFHDLRHQFASWLLAGGENVRLVAELLGHQDSSLTLRTYSHVLPQAKVDAMSRLDRVLSGS